MPLRNRSMVPSTASRVMIRVEQYGADRMAGLIYNPYLDKIEPFTDVMDLTNKLDGMMDSISFPQATTSYRSFKQRKKPAPQEADSLEGQTEQGEKEMKSSLRKQESDVFVVHVQFRQNATWQGTIKWAGQNEEIRFRSTLEMLKIMDGALSAGHGGGEGEAGFQKPAAPAEE